MLMQCCLSLGVRHPLHGDPYPCPPCVLQPPHLPLRKTLISALELVSYPRSSCIQGFRHIWVFGLAYILQLRSNSLAFSTRPARVSGCSDRRRILLWRAEFRAWQKAYILVISSVPACLACWLHSWYHLLNSRVPLLHFWVIFLFLYLLFLYFYFILLTPALLWGPLDLPAHS